MVNKKNIVFFISNLSGGGAEGVCVKIANSLVKRGWRVTVLVQNLKNGVNAKKLDSDVSLESLDCLHIRNAFFKIRSWVNKNNPSKVVVFNYYLSIMLILVRATVRNRFYILSRNINSFSHLSQHENNVLRSFFLSRIVKWGYGKSDVVINQCNGMHQGFLQHFPVMKHKSLVIYNPSNADLSTETLHNSPTEDYIVFVGRLEKQKAVHYAINAFDKISGYYPKLKLKIIGDGSLRCELEELVQQKKLTEKVEFLGFQSKPSQYIRHARLMLLTSLFEGFPNVLVESIGCGTPVVSFDCPNGPNEIIEPGKNGFLAKYLDEGDLVRKLRECLDSPPLREDVLASAVKFSLDTITEQWERVLTDGK